MRRVLVWMSSVGLLVGALVMGTQVTSAPEAKAAVNGAWSALGGGLNGRVFVTYQADDTTAISASNPLYVGGAFTNAGGDADADYLAKWDGSTWSKVATTAFTPRGGVFLNYVASIAKSGSNLYVGGVFAAGSSINIASIDITTGGVSGLSNGVNLLMSGGTVLEGRDDAVVEEIAVIGSTVYVGGAFGAAFNGATAATNTAGIAKWDGATWSDLSGGIAASRLVNGMATDGTTLYVGGQSPGTASITSQSVMSWNGTAWAAMSTTQRGFTRSSNPLTAAMLARSSTEVYAAGRFDSTNDSTAGDRITLNGVAKWDGTAWSALGSGVSGGNAVVETLAYKGSTLWAGGDFTTAGGVSATNIAKWDGSSWEAITCAANNGVSGGAVRGIAPQSDGSLIIAGGFTNAGGISYIAKFTPGADNCTTLTDGPTEPRNVYAEWHPVIDSIRITWDPPESTGGLQITGYRAVSFDDKVSCWSAAFSCEISALDVPDSARTADGQPARERFQKYIYLDQIVKQSGVPLGFYVQAGTSLGWGKKGWSTKPEPSFPPAAATNVRATPGRNTVTVTWSPATVPASRGARAYPITNYLVTAQPSGQVCITRLTDASLTTCTFTKLTSGVNYKFIVQALNGMGWGDRSKLSNEVSPYDLTIGKTSAKKKLLILREITVNATAPGYLAGANLRLSWRQEGTTEWQTSKAGLKKATGDPKTRYTYTITLPRKAGGKNFEFRVGSGGEFSETTLVRIP